ncbi:hypothetical protein CSV69_08125 [Sporosarcina sp. P26b]|nr:hypothetical protein CSV69_08125 [Sporosarcina sp. P26b]
MKSPLHRWLSEIRQHKRYITETLESELSKLLIGMQRAKAHHCFTTQHPKRNPPLLADIQYILAGLLSSRFILLLSLWRVAFFNDEMLVNAQCNGVSAL